MQRVEMNWKEVCESPELQNLPFKLELNKDGKVVMNAVQVNHALFAGKIIHFFRDPTPNGYSLPEFPIMKNFFRNLCKSEISSQHPEKTV